MTNALHSELFRLRKRPQAWIMPVLAVVFIAAFYVILFLVYQFGAESNQPDLRDSFRVANIYENGMAIFGFFGGILTVIVASSLIGSEYSWNTLRPLVARAQSRSGLLSAKWVMVLLYTILMTVVGIVGAMVLAAIGSALTSTSISVSADEWMLLGEGLLRWIVAMLPYSALAFAAALITRSNAAGIAIGIGLAFVEPLIFGLLTLISDVFGTIQEYGISWNQSQLTTLSAHPESAAAFESPVSTGQVWESIAILLIYTAIFVIASYLVFSRRDITSG